MRFTNQLRQLSASVTSSQKAAQYALRHKDLAEDLHSCILEQLERVCYVFLSSCLFIHSTLSGHCYVKPTSSLPTARLGSLVHLISATVSLTKKNVPEQPKHASQHHVLHRALSRHGPQRRPRGLHPHDAAGHYSCGRCRGAG